MRATGAPAGFAVAQCGPVQQRPAAVLDYATQASPR
jgi:hypothetical protein